jgi:hypothetical protein
MNTAITARSLRDIEDETAEIEEALLLHLHPESRLQLQLALERLRQERDRAHAADRV